MGLDFCPGAIQKRGFPSIFQYAQKMFNREHLLLHRCCGQVACNYGFSGALECTRLGKTVCDGKVAGEKNLSPTQMKDFGRKFVVKKDQKDLPILRVRDLFGESEIP